ncbi:MULTISPECIES: hypothetical protein [Geobacillus]|uniref:Uncharacterized protein n=1 Tax=Geobacillus thermocatenulatus TaxID=33938 RepID=A0A226QCG9_9BACL|nr:MULTISPECIES: hypothetical protein [Geobacillus]KPD01201.1 hypothetical protein LR69_00686 [Geobacillus sp. BCO2]RAN22842.1 hypothetical protein VC88_09125 [Geobacillus sp. A8]ASS98929.1 hypothetical protein GT3921_07625 [Geobacillus thermocatenulatus]KLR73664.1 hypothetical protein ABH20_09920 [Geobacillus sp. T6]OXB89684.1 hypothetical protein B9L19_06410 [Geobacillus thermocatenulatus]
MKLNKLTSAILGSAILLTSAIPHVFAAEPTYASLSPANETKIGTSAYFTKQLSWGGGATNTYYVEYWNGVTTSFYDPKANYYSTYSTSYYNKGSLSTKTWYTSLYVSNGTSDAAYGSVTLKDR